MVASAPRGRFIGFRFVGGNDPKTYSEAKAAGKLNELPVNHSPQFAPVLHPTLETGVEALVVGALAWLGPLMFVCIDGCGGSRNGYN